MTLLTWFRNERERIKAQEQAATKTPWHVDGDQVRDCANVQIAVMDYFDPKETRLANASLIAKGRTDLPRLLALCEALLKEHEMGTAYRLEKRKARIPSLALVENWKVWQKACRAVEERILGLDRSET